LKVFHDFKSKQTNQDEYGSLRTKEIVIRKYEIQFLYNQLKPEGLLYYLLPTVQQLKKKIICN